MRGGRYEQLQAVKDFYFQLIGEKARFDQLRGQAIDNTIVLTFVISVQQAIQDATGIAPSAPQQPKPADISAVAQPFPVVAQAGDPSTSDVLKAVTQLLQQSQQVNMAHASQVGGDEGLDSIMMYTTMGILNYR